MAESLGSAVLTLTIDDTQYNAGLQRAKQTADRTLGAVKGPNLGGGLTALTGGLAAATTAAAVVAAAVAAIAVPATLAAGKIQKLQAAFTGLTGSAEAATKLRQQLFDLSKTTPFKNEEILQASQRFLAVGVNVENLNGTLNRVGALASQAGQPLERLALIYSQVYAKGRLQGEENLQLLEAGVDLSQELAQVTGLTGTALQNAMSNGQIGINAFNKALVLATGDMTALQQAGKAVDVQFNNIGDNLGQLFGGFAQAISPALSAAFKVINDVFESAFPDLNSIVEFFAPLTKEAQNFANVLGSSPATIEVIAAGLKSVGGAIVQNIADGLKFVSDVLANIDQKSFIQGFINAEIVVRRLFLASSALGAQLAKNAELSARALSNPIQFGKDISKAGGFGKFIEKEYELVESKWNAWANSEPLSFPDLTGKGAAQANAIAGDLSNKLNGVITDKEAIARRASTLKIDAILDKTSIANQLASAGSANRPGLAVKLNANFDVAEAKRRESETLSQLNAAKASRANSQEISKLTENYNEAVASTSLAVSEGALAFKEFNEQIQSQAIAEARAMLESQFQEGMSAVESAAQEAASAAQEAAGGFKSAADSYISAQEGLKNAQRAAFDYLSRSAQKTLTTEARNLIKEAGFKNTAGLSEKDVLGVGQLAKGVLDAEKASENSREDLTKAMNDLASKNWNVVVEVTGGEANAYGDVLNRAITA